MPGAMRRLLRILTRVATVLSLVLCVATVVLWVRSRWVCDYITVLDVPTFEAQVCSHPQGLEFLAMPRSVFAGDLYRPSSLWNVWSVPPSVAGPLINSDGRDSWRGGLWSGFGWERWTMRVQWVQTPPPATGFYTIQAHGWVVPHWTLAIVLGALPLGSEVVRRRMRRRRCTGLCPACGYDLRATPEDQCRYPLNYEARIRAD
jgi:hypothetical protein